MTDNLLSQWNGFARSLCPVEDDYGDEKTTTTTVFRVASAPAAKDVYLSEGPLSFSVNGKVISRNNDIFQ